MRVEDWQTSRREDPIVTTLLARAQRCIISCHRRRHDMSKDVAEVDKPYRVGVNVQHPTSESSIRTTAGGGWSASSCDDSEGYAAIRAFRSGNEGADEDEKSNCRDGDG
jgi:hypothetical protein